MEADANTAIHAHQIHAKTAVCAHRRESLVDSVVTVLQDSWEDFAKTEIHALTMDHVELTVNV